MRFILTICTFCFLATNASFGADTKKPVLRWHGHSYFDLTTSKGTRIVFDPHAIEGYGQQSVPADLVLISHSHNDHNQIAILSNPGKFKVLEGLKQRTRSSSWKRMESVLSISATWATCLPRNKSRKSDRWMC